MEKLFEKRILPAITFDDSTLAVQVAEAVLKGGLDIMEVPFRTKVAGDSIRLIRNAIPNMKIGAGTILTPSQVVEAKEAGALFGLAPGFNPAVVKEAIKNEFMFIPGVMTPSEVEMALEMGCTIQKLFPASLVGGIDMLKALYGPYAHTDVKFIPMGGVSLMNMSDYLALPNVIAIGGSWLATKDLVSQNKFETICQNVTNACKISLEQ